MQKFVVISCFFVLCFINTIKLQANIATTDSLLNILWRTENNLEKVKILNQLALIYSEINNERAIDYAQQALSLANKSQDNEACAVSNCIMAEIFEKENNLQPTINYYLISISYYKKLNNCQMLATLYNRLGKLYIQNQYDYNQGLNYFRESLDNAQRCQLQHEIAIALNSIGGVFFYQKEYDLAFQYFTQSLEISEKIDDKSRIAISHNNRGEIYRSRNENEKALEQYNKARKINETHAFNENLAINYNNIGLTYSALNQFDKAIEYFNKSIAIDQQENNKPGVILALINIGEHQNEFKHFEEAIQTFRQAKQLASEQADLKGLVNATNGLTIAYEGLGNTKEALNNFKQYAMLKDSLFAKTKENQLDEIKTRLSLDLKEKELILKNNEIALLQREKRITYFQQIVLLLTILILVFIALFIYYRLRSRNKKHQSLLEQKEAINKIREEVMQTEIRNKSNELTNYALHLGERNKFLLELKSELKKLKHIPEKEREEKIKELTLSVQQNIQMQQDLETFQQSINQNSKEFYDKLKIRFPNLTKSEVRLCALLRLDLSTKEIAALNNISTRAVEMGRYRLRKKLDIDPKDNIVAFLQQIS